ncbi:hypothetical protein Cgig2_033526 [Carnegiea gigantea]|uniref:Uncharacterized protein n=1 Tax=Carnegiea gigantea TaxID=171969 RepID=A0A9Q1JH62_9CARY|nr:hypothetical protein Cgig2_033526 [Carnegiea gigantea]
MESKSLWVLILVKFQDIIDKVDKPLAGWNTRCLSLAERATLVCDELDTKTRKFVRRVCHLRESLFIQLGNDNYFKRSYQIGTEASKLGLKSMRDHYAKRLKGKVGGMSEWWVLINSDGIAKGNPSPTRYKGSSKVIEESGLAVMGYIFQKIMVFTRYGFMYIDSIILVGYNYQL